MLSLVAAIGCINEGVAPSGDSTTASIPLDEIAPPRSANAAKPAPGDVLIAGGAGASLRTLAKTEFFDQAAQKFVVTGSAISNRAGGAAIAIASSKVLLAGGFSGGASINHFTLSLEGNVVSAAEIFDEATGSSSAVSEMTVPRMGFTATLLASGKVLIAGGLDNNGSVLASAELYDPATGKFTPTSNTMSDHRVFHGATLLPGGKVLITGGATNLFGDTTNSADVYDPAANTFTPTGTAMDHQRAAHTSTILKAGPLAGKVMIAGGGGGSSFFLKDSSAEIYDPASGQFGLLTSFLNEARSMHTATVLDDGSVLLAGGFNGSVAIAGGALSGASGVISNSAEIFDPNSMEFNCVVGFNTDTLRCNQSMTSARAGQTATLFTTGKLRKQVLIAGGIGGNQPQAKGTPLSSAEIFNPASSSFTATSPMTTSRALHTASELR
ncbi:MAG: kelch repeat-containing protein [Candidatus Binatus sp.]|uniref:Kelch repeat-containing protein n=1 Tax=Candidatus Binatus sp. TaxID=2811406 RepID=UPI0027243377|nr:kelch repeat-containing protein [Candidatus Binatus sp.]MDO8431121.1 kelch repeat-containing protein [Candidatus Binatus sp.]